MVSNHFTALLKLKNYKSYVEENKKYIHVFFVCSDIAKLKRLTVDIRCALRAWPSASRPKFSFGKLLLIGICYIQLELRLSCEAFM